MQTERRLMVKIFNRIRLSHGQFKKKIRVFKFRLLGAEIGKKVALGNVFIPFPEQLVIGDFCKIEDNVRLRIGGAWKKSFISIGAETFIGHSTQINVGGIFKIGKKCMVAPMCIFSDAHHTFSDVTIPMNQQECIYSPIEVEDDVWIGSGVTILGGVKIHTGAVIAAGAVVNSDVPAFEIWGGVPAKKIKSRI